MSSAQTKILSLVRNMIADHGLEPVVKAQWANTGAILVEREGAFGAIAKVTYSFQDDRFTLSIYRCVGERDIGVPSQPPRQGYFDHYLSYSDRAGFETFKRIFQQTLDGVAPKAVAPARETVKNAAGKYLLEFTPDCSADYRRGFMAAIGFFDGGDGFQMDSTGGGSDRGPEWVLLQVPNQDNATYSVRGDGNVEFESTGVEI
jgi:hypothetical protein